MAGFPIEAQLQTYKRKRKLTASWTNEDTATMTKNNLDEDFRNETRNSSNTSTITQLSSHVPITYVEIPKKSLPFSRIKKQRKVTLNFEPK